MKTVASTLRQLFGNLSHYFDDGEGLIGIYEREERLYYWYRYDPGTGQYRWTGTSLSPGDATFRTV